MATITAHYARAALHGAQRQGYDTADWLQQVAIDPQQLRDPNARVNDTKLSALIRIIWREMADEFMGCTASPCKPGTFALMCELAAQADTIESAFQQGIRFYHLLSSDIAMRFYHDGEHCHFEVDMRDPALYKAHYIQEFWLVNWHRFMSWLCGRQIKLHSVHFAYARPAHAHEFKHQFNCRCYYERNKTRLSFPLHYARQAPIRTRREIARFIKQSPALIMTIPEEDGSYTRQVKRLLQEHLSHGQLPAMETLSSMLAVSPQTLRRRLQTEGSSFNGIKNQLLCDKAVEQLLVHKQDIDSVASALGFGESSSFIRAFKRWTGNTPQQYLRARLSTQR
jgi:AraC-like DNA-binding protein